MSENVTNKGKPEPRFDAEQYERLLRCSAKKDMAEWNEWREKHREIPILLEGADLRGAHLEGAVLRRAHLEGAHLEGVHLWKACLKGAHLEDAHLEGADLRRVLLEGADLRRAHLADAVLKSAHLGGAGLWNARLEGCNLEAATVDARTYIFECTIDEKTNFLGVGLDSARIHPGLKERLEGNIRKRRWLEWYRKRRCARWPVLVFWWMSDYGRSTTRVITAFCAWAFFFAVIYYVLGAIDHYPHKNLPDPGVVKNLFTLDGNSATGKVIPVSDWIIPLRAVYFSIVTMTTLGFGDMYANPGSWLGHALLAIQVLMGYVLLGVLVTRFAVLFTAQGPGDG